MVKNAASSTPAPKRAITKGKLPMDHPVHGIEATVIDLGLARMEAEYEDGELDVRWTPFDEEIFEGEGLCYSNSMFTQTKI